MIEKARTVTWINSCDVVKSSNFSSCVEPHIYGCQPQGNIYLLSGASFCKQLIHGREEIWQSILSFCDGTTLGRIIQTCRELYIAGHQPELWRDLVLGRLSGNVLKSVGACWKDTYVLLQLKRTAMKYRSHTPMKISGFFSDHFYQSHLCRSFVIPKKWLSVEGGTVERVDRLSIKEFISNYELPNIPVVLAGACQKWKAVQDWNSKDYLIQALKKTEKERTFRATSGTSSFAAQFTVNSYLDYCQNDEKMLEEAPLYLFDRAALLDDGPLREDYYPDLQQSCPYFDPSRIKENGHDLFQLLGEQSRPDHTWLIVGPKRSGSSFHIDPNATHAWNATVVGKKRWIFYPPGQTPPGIHPSPDGDDVVMPISVGEWLIKYWDAHCERRQSAKFSSSEKPLECTVQPGDIVFVPHGWWHSVVNLDGPFNIAITHNYVSRSNLPNVLRFLETKQSQISGCRDRPAVAIQPEHLSNEFRKVLRKYYPSWLKEAETVDDWTCATWKNQNRKDDRKNIHQGKNWWNRKKRKQQEISGGNSILSKVEDTNDKGFSFSFL